MAAISDKDIYQGKQNPFNDAAKGGEALLKVMSDLIAKGKELSSVTIGEIKSNPKQTAEDLKKLTEQTNRLSEVNKAANEISKEKARLENTLTKLRNDQSKANERLKVQIQEQRRANKDLAKDQLGLVGSYEKLNKQLTDARKKAKDIAAQYGVTSKQFRTSAKDVLRLDANIKKIDKSLGLSQREVGNYGLAFKGATSSLIKFGASFVSLSAGFRIISSSLRTIAEFEKAMNEVAAITGATNEEFRLLEKNALRLGATTSKTAKEVSGLQKEFAKLGFSTSEILDATEATISLSIAAGSDLSESAVVAASTIRGFSLDASETQRVVDIMAKSFTTTGLDLQKFSVAMANAQVAARATGNTLEFTAAALGTIVDTGTDASKAGTDLRKIFSDLTKKGISLNDAFAKVRNSGDKVSVAIDLVGDRAFSSLITLSENTEKLRELEDAYKKSSGSAKEMADIMEDNLIGDVTKLSSAWDGFILGLNSGEGSITRVLRTLTQGLTDAITKIKELNTSIEDLSSDRAEQSFKSTRDFILRQDKQFQEARLKQFIESERVTLASIQRELDKQGESIWYSKRTLRDLNLRLEESKKVIDLLVGFEKELQQQREEESKLTQAQIELILKYNLALNKNLELNEASFQVAKDYFANLKQQENTLETLKKKLQELEAEKKKIDVDDLERLKNKEEEIEKIKEEIKVLENLYKILSDKPEDAKIELDVELNLDDTTGILQDLEEERLNEINKKVEEALKARENIYNEHYDNLFDIFANYATRRQIQNQDLTAEEIQEIDQRNQQVSIHSLLILCY